MHIGVIAESQDNIYVLRAFCQRILDEENIYIIKQNQRFVSTQILPKNIQSIGNSFLKIKKHKPKFLIFLTDMDKNKKIKVELEQEVQKLSIHAIIVVPVTKIENWLVCDINAINTVLKSNISLPGHKLDAKSWLQDQIGKSSLSYTVACTRIAKQASFKKIGKDFQEFVVDLKRIVLELESKQNQVVKNKNKRKSLTNKVINQYLKALNKPIVSDKRRK